MPFAPGRDPSIGHRGGQVLSAVPVERLDRDDHAAFDGRRIARDGEAPNDRRIVGRDEPGAPEDLQPHPFDMAHRDPCDAPVMGEVAGADGPAKAAKPIIRSSRTRGIP